MTRVKSVLSWIFVALVLVAALTFHFLDHLADSHALAPMYAVLGATGVFVALIPAKGSGKWHRAADILLRATTALAVFLSGWQWLLATDAVREHLLVWAVGVLAGLLTVVAVTVTFCGNPHETEGGGEG